MPTTIDVSSVDQWVNENVLEKDAWTDADRPDIAVKQATRNLQRWYPETELSIEVVAYQAIWELQGIDPALKYQKHNVKTVTDNGESISYKDGERPVVAPFVRELLGPTADEIAQQEAEDAAQRQYGGVLL
ncbi:hypothetical protein BEP19_14870 [Ammoniphilus oxalaticus]|uniref:Uncharacterized protein n=1 Tax=Ammoniphilus oxalaticus TaxID=66863 RepID=A0A419SCZ9_9BACL|nr:hypothetical protein [Ammoniphilus oxalaticus]RKD20966.1 hypothetical protein BEP19_14870 [Ammoniphilus oxalaticus]